MMINCGTMLVLVFFVPSLSTSPTHLILEEQGDIGLSCEDKCTNLIQWFCESMTSDYLIESNCIETSICELLCGNEDDDNKTKRQSSCLQVCDGKFKLCSNMARMYAQSQKCKSQRYICKGRCEK